MTRILVTGGAGQVGQALRRQIRDGDIEYSFPDRAQFDLLSEKSMVEGLRTFKPNLILNLAAYTAVERAEDEPELCAAINTAAPALLARETQQLGIPLIHISTDYVFSGQLDRPYREDDPTSPINVYGRTKCLGEEAILASNPAHVIVRASWIVSSYRANFIKTMLRLAADRDSIRVIDDQIGGPTSADDLAQALLTIIDRHFLQRELKPGIFHFSNQGAASWADLAEAVMASSTILGGVNARIERITTKEYNSKVRRPANSRLDTNKIMVQYGIRASVWQEAVMGIVKDLAERV